MGEQGLQLAGTKRGLNSSDLEQVAFLRNDSNSITNKDNNEENVKNVIATRAIDIGNRGVLLSHIDHEKGSRSIITKRIIKNNQITTSDGIVVLLSHVNHSCQGSAMTKNVINNKKKVVALSHLNHNIYNHELILSNMLHQKKKQKFAYADYSSDSSSCTDSFSSDSSYSSTNSSTFDRNVTKINTFDSNSSSSSIISHINAGKRVNAKYNNNNSIKAINTNTQNGSSNKKTIENLQDFLISIVNQKKGENCVKVQTHESAADFFIPPTTEEVMYYNTDVLKAINTKDLETLRSYLRQGRPLKCSNKFGESILHLACRKGFFDVVKFLISEANVPVNVRDDYGRSPLHDAFWTITPNYDIVDLIIKKCPDLLYISDRRGFTPVSYARKESHDKWKAHLSNMSDFVVPKNICCGT